jgi:serine/threonine-protein kinase
MALKGLDPTQAARLSSLLDEALALAPESRAAWLAALETRDPMAGADVRALLVSLSAAHADRLLETKGFVAGFAAALGADEMLAGREIGPYRVLRPIGRGGMGTVWLAERADGLFERKVALKLVHPVLVGSVLAERFARERAILAGLEHPHIARLLDAGVTPGGQPYLALEYVEGTPLTAYCDAHRLDLDARIRLFQQVLGAVQYAHANLVIHRDLKPSNILVTEAGEALLLDFGIAKLLTVEGEARETELTQMSGRAFTPEYASPEQITGAPITTASDVYALGVVFYELLCGRRPYALKRESLGALEEAIVAAEPSNPSATDITDAIAAARSTTPKALHRQLRGDLDTIAQKALRKRPAERYGSPLEMLQELERYRRGEPVLARPDGAGYRLRKFVARNKLVVGAATATTLALTVGLAGALWQAGVAREQARVARSEAARATAVQDFLLNLFRANSVEQPDPAKARETTARELLDLGSRGIDTSLKSAPDARYNVIGTLADMYHQLGMFEEAARQHELGVAAATEAYGPGDPRVADALISYADDISNLPGRARQLPALEQAKRILDAAPDDGSEARGRLLLMLAQAQSYTAVDRMREYADRAVAFFRDRFPNSSNLSIALAYAAGSRMRKGDAEGAETLYEQAIAAVPREGDDSAWRVFPLVGLAEAQEALGKIDAAERSYRTALDIAQNRFGDFHPETLLTRVKLGAFLELTGRRAEGERLMKAALAGIGKAKGGYSPPFVAAVLSGLRGRVLLAEGRFEEAAPLIAVDADDARTNFPESVPLANSLLNLLMLDTAQGRYDRATAHADEALRIVETTGGGAFTLRNRLLLEQARLRLARGEAEAALDTLATIAPPPYAAKQPLRVQDVSRKTLQSEARLQQRRPREAVALAQDAVDQIVTSPLRPFYPRLEADAALRLGNALRETGDADRARASLERAVQLREANDDPRSPWLAQAEAALAACLAQLGERRQAAVWRAKAEAIDRAHAELGPHVVASASKRPARPPAP